MANLEDKMKGYKLSEDKKHVDMIIEGILKKDGHCPCRLAKDDTTLCPCDDFMENGNCECKLFLKIEE
ncbi:MAG: ferredoxin-thioredoxin reductase catalytic domain-containing protein [Anaerovoracaceae bacterium]